MKIQHNISAMNAERNLGNNRDSLAKNLEKLSSGYRINRSADDAAGLAISEKMRLSISGYEQGENNVNDGISLLKIADGSLQEIQELLTRMVSLSTQAANDTISDEERRHIQKEIDQILQEITRIKNDAEFNGIPLFDGHTEIILDEDGTPTIGGEIEFDDFALVNTNLGLHPYPNSSADMLALQAIVNNPDSGVYGSTYQLIYNNGTTSDSSMKVTYTQTDGRTVSETIDFDVLQLVGQSGDIASPSNPLCRTFNPPSNSDVPVQIIQKIHVTEHANEKFYNIEYEFKNTGTGTLEAKFMFHADTAYNERDYEERYFINGQMVTETAVYTNGQGLVADEFSKGTTPDSLSIINTQRSLAFSEKIEFVGTKPDMSVDRYDKNRTWPYFDNPDINVSTNANAGGEDLGISLVWKLDEMGANESSAVQFKYGIVAAEHDDNLTGVPITPDTSVVSQHSAIKKIWIQASANDGDDGMWLQLQEMDNRILGVDGLNVTTRENAVASIQRAEKAKDIVSSISGQIGADQNRLEHMLNNLGVMKENLVMSESQIRDVDVAAEMMEYTKNNILTQSAQAMLAQSNQVPQGVLQLMQ